VPLLCALAPMVVWYCAWAFGRIQGGSRILEAKRKEELQGNSVFPPHHGAPHRAAFFG